MIIGLSEIGRHLICIFTAWPGRIIASDSNSSGKSHANWTCNLHISSSSLAEIGAHVYFLCVNQITVLIQENKAIWVAEFQLNFRFGWNSIESVPICILLRCSLVGAVQTHHYTRGICIFWTRSLFFWKFLEILDWSQPWHLICIFSGYNPMNREVRNRRPRPIPGKIRYIQLGIWLTSFPICKWAGSVSAFPNFSLIKSYHLGVNN